MSSLIARDITFSRGAAQVLSGVSLSVAPGDRVGVVGANGVGKSTLLGILAGELTPDAGRVERQPADLVVGLVAQQRSPRPGETVRQHLARRTGVTGADAEFRASIAALEGGEADADERYAAALERWNSLGCVDFEARLGSVMAQLGLSAIPAHRPVEGLSGGEASRVELAVVLLHKADILLLDEPTNDLDLDGLEILESSVLEPHRGIVVVSHDRAFLERVVTHVVEIDEHTRRAATHAGGWAAFQEERARARRRAEEKHGVYATEKERLTEQARREKRWAAQGLRAIKKSGETDKHIRSAKKAGAESRERSSGRTRHRLERLEVVEKPFEGWELRLGLAEAERGSTVVAELSDATSRRGEFTLGPVNLVLRAGDRVGLQGPNGSGKTTLIDLILKRVEPAAGTVRLGPSVVPGVLGQERDRYEARAPLLQRFVQLTGTPEADARSSLAKLGLGPDHVARPSGELSPGERTRAVLAEFQVRGVNLLVLDEPTNHLDLPAIEQLEQVLSTYGGTLIVVSHDRRFLEALELGRTWRMDAGRLTES